MANDLIIQEIPNPFDRITSIQKLVEYRSYITIKDVMDEYLPSCVDFSVSVNRRVIDKEFWHLHYLLPGDVLIVAPRIYGSNGTSVMGVVLPIVFGIVGAIVGTVFLGPVFGTYLGAQAGAALGAALGGIAGSYIGSAIVNAFGWGPGAPSVPQISMPKPDLTFDPPAFAGIGGMGGGEDWGSSQNYTWEKFSAQSQGITVPIVYGQIRTSGNVIAGETFDDGSKSWLYLLFSLGLGMIHDVRGIMINEKSASLYSSVETEYRNGLISQSTSSYFTQTKAPHDVGVRLVQNVATIYETVNDDWDELELEFYFPGGLFSVDPETGEKGGSHVELTFHVYNVTNPQPAPNDWAWVNSPQFIDSDESKGFFRRYVLDFGAYRQKRPSGSDDNYDYLPFGKGRYQISVTRTTANRQDTSLYATDDCIFNQVNEVYYNKFTYPRHALCAIKALATNEISGTVNCSFLVRGKYIWGYYQGYWYYQYSTTPAWVAYDILTQPVSKDSCYYDLSNGRLGPLTYAQYLAYVERFDGVNPSYVDYAAFYEWAQYCDELVPTYPGSSSTEKRFVFNGVIDSGSSLWDIFVKVCRSFRAMPVLRGYKYSIVVDKPGTAVALFTVGNIEKDSFKEVFTSYEDRCNEYQIEFLNEENNYEREGITVVDPDWNSVSNVESMQLIGTTTYSQAWRIGRARIAHNRYISRTIEFDCDVDAINCAVGDIIKVQHDVPTWGEGGRIVSATANTVTLDKEVTLSAGTTYVITLRLHDDTIVTKTIVDGAGSYTTLNITPVFSSIPEGTTNGNPEPYAFGASAIETKEFRILAITRSQDTKFSLTCVEYIAGVYVTDSTSPDIRNITYTSLDLFPAVTNLVLDEILVKAQDGSLDDCIDLAYDKPNSSVYAHANIYLGWYKDSITNGSQSAAGDYTDYEWYYWDKDSSGKRRVNRLQVGVHYGIGIRTVNVAGQEAGPSEMVYDSLITLGKADPPSNVTNFKAYQNLTIVTFSWDHIEDGDLWGYEIRQGVTYENSIEIIDIQSANRYDWPIPLNGTYRFWIKAIDTSGNYSSTPSSLDITVTGVDDMLNFVYDADIIADAGAGGPSGEAYHYVWTSGEYYQWYVSGEAGSGTSPSWSGEFISNPDFLAYYQSDFIQIADVSLSSTIRLQETTDIEAVGATDQTFPDRTDQTYPYDTDQHITTITPTYLYYQVSTDGTTSGEFTRYLGPVRESLKYIRIREVAVADNYNTQVQLTNLRVAVDMDDIDFDIKGLSVSAAGTTVTYSTYGYDLYIVPLIQATTSYRSGSMTAISLVPVVYEITADDFKIKLVDIAGQGRDGYANINVHGY